MTQQKHTPGPWTFGPLKTNQEPAGVFSHLILGNNSSRIVASINHHYGQSLKGDMYKIQEADARLIAAAPELLEVLRDVSLLPIAFAYPDGPCIDSCMMDDIRKAIAKAEGGVK